MHRKMQMLLYGVLLISLLGCVQKFSTEDRTPRVTKEELLAMMDRPEVVIIDVRKESVWRTGNMRIKGSVREDSNQDPRTWAGKYSHDKMLVFYCD